MPKTPENWVTSWKKRPTPTASMIGRGNTKGPGTTKTSTQPPTPWVPTGKYPENWPPTPSTPSTSRSSQHSYSNPRDSIIPQSPRQTRNNPRASTTSTDISQTLAKANDQPSHQDTKQPGHRNTGPRFSSHNYPHDHARPTPSSRIRCFTLNT